MKINVNYSFMGDTKYDPSILQRNSQNIKTYMQKMGNEIVEVIKLRMDAKKTPRDKDFLKLYNVGSLSGRDYKKLSPLTLSRKTKKNKILEETGALKKSIKNRLVNKNTTKIVVGEKYGIYHQTGTRTRQKRRGRPSGQSKRQRMPARPFFAVDRDVQDAIAKTMVYFLFTGDYQSLLKSSIRGGGFWTAI